MPSWHHQYRGQSAGRILHFLYHYCGFDVAEMAEIGINQITYRGEVIATYRFLSDTDIPHFIFEPIKSYGGHDMKEMWEENQKNNWHVAIADAKDTVPEPCNECKNLKLKLSILGACFEKSCKEPR